MNFSPPTPEQVSNYRTGQGQADPKLAGDEGSQAGLNSHGVENVHDEQVMAGMQQSCWPQAS